MMGRIAFLAAVAVAAPALAAENPLVEMFGDDVTFVENCETQKLAVAGGLFGKCLDRGGFGRRIVAPSEVFDTAKPGTMLCWLRLKPGLDLEVFRKPGAERLSEPGFTLFEAQFAGPQHQLLGTKPDGQGVVSAYHVETGADNRVRVAGTSTSAPLRTWEPGRWHLFAMYWSPEKIGVSFDGGPWSDMILSAPMKPFTGYLLWRVPTGLKTTPVGSYQIDEAALLACVPEERELKAYYEATLARAAGKVVKIKATEKKSGLASRIAFKFAYYPYHSKIHAAVSLGSLPDPEAVKAVRLEVRSSKGRVVAAKDFTPDAAHALDVIWPIPDLAPLTKASGSADYTIAMIPKGIADATIEKPFKRSVFEWERNRYGLSGAVPAPFEPVRREQGTGNREQEKVSVVLRDHIVDRKTGLWKQVTAAGKDILARPMRFVSASKTCSLFPVPCSLSTSSTWDIDGMMLWNLTLKPGHYEPMSLEIPIRAERAKLMHACVDSLRSNYAGEVPAGSGRVWHGGMAPGRSSIVGDYVPYIWVGGPLRGIAVFGDNDRGWVLGEGKSKSEKGKSAEIPCQEIVREKDGTVVIRLNLIQKACDLTEERTIRIGFQATPVKPMRKDWRSWSTGNLLGCCLYWGGYEDSHAVRPHDGTDAFWKKMGEARRTGETDREFLRAFSRAYDTGADPASPVHTQRLQRASVHFGAGMHVAAESFRKPCALVWYTNGRGVHYGTPEGETFCDEWNRGMYMTRKFTIRSMAAYELDPCRSYLDYAAWWWKKAFDSGALDRLYWDDVYLSVCTDPVGTDTYRLPSGLVQGSSGIFNMRAQVRRGAVLQAELGKDPTGNWIHMTNTAMAPVSAFAGVHYDWEDPHFGNVFQERYSRAYCQACAIGRQMGVKVGVMGYFTTAKKEDLPRLKRCSAGVTLTHELGWWKPETVKKALADFGYGVAGADVKVWNYWDEDVAFPVAIDGLEWSALAMAKGNEALIIVCNYENRAATARVRPDAGTLGLAKGFGAVNAETGTALAVKNGVVEADLAPYDFVVMRLR